MQFRTYRNTDLTVSAVGFGLWTISTGWWGQFTEGEAVALMHRALDLGITLFDAADTYGNGLSETLIAKAFPTRRDDIVVATKIGYDVANHGSDERRGQRAIPHDFSPEALTLATENALRLAQDRPDRPAPAPQHRHGRGGRRHDLGNDGQRSSPSGKVRYHGFALGPAIGWMYEGIRGIERRNVTSVQHIYNLLEPHPGRSIHEAAERTGKDTMFLVRVPHSSGMLEGHYTEDTVFPPTDHRVHRPRSWLLNGIKKVDKLRFLEGPDRTLGQAALLWLLADARTASTLPNIYNEEQLAEFAKTTDAPALGEDELARIAELSRENFGVTEEASKYKGTMEPPAEAELAAAQA